MLLKAKNKNASLDLDAMIRMNADAIASLGHVSFDLSQRRRDTIRPYLNSDYATLCSSNVPVTALLFGDELQTQLNHIRASNKISNTASTSAAGYSGAHSRQYKYREQKSQNYKPFLGRASHYREKSKRNNRYQYQNKKKSRESTDQN